MSDEPSPELPEPRGGEAPPPAFHDPAAARIADRAPAEVRARLREALAAEAAVAGVPLADARLDELAAEAAGRAGGALWRRALAEVATAELGIDLGEAVRHPAVARAHELIGAPAYEPPPAAGTEAGAGAPATRPEPEAPPSEARPDALRIPAVHLGGIEALRAGERDLELRFSAAGLDVLKRSSGAPIGRLEWTEIQTVDIPQPRRGLRRGRRGRELHVATERGRASFELPGLTEEQLTQHLAPMLARVRIEAATRE